MSLVKNSMQNFGVFNVKWTFNNKNEIIIKLKISIFYIGKISIFYIGKISIHFVVKLLV
jgi:hypothetical protein